VFGDFKSVVYSHR